jgi:murein DD-endopeptidase MepM/ murein hydrolase activator NlpD
MEFNQIADPSKLPIGKQLRIPQAAGFTEYKVLKNETLYSIARRNGITLDALREANGFTVNHVLKEGERIRIPGESGSVSGTGGPVAPVAPVPEKTTNTATGTPPADPRSTALKTVDASLRWPVKPKGIAYMTGKLSGVVVTGEQAEPVRSLAQGTVVSAGPYRGFGRVAIVQVTGGYLYVYGGCESLSVKEGDQVGSGTELGKLGIDGVSQKPQLFFLVYRNNNPIDPSKAPRT